MVVLLAVGTIIGTILFSSLRGGSKTNTITSLRQSGNFVISQMAKTIRNAKQFDGVSQDSLNYQTNCTTIIPPSPTPTPTPKRYKSIALTSSADEKIVFSCDALTILDQSVAVLESDSCFFTCTQDSFSNAPTIGINFTLTTKAGLILEKSASPITFSTSVIMRNAPR